MRTICECSKCKVQAPAMSLEDRCFIDGCEGVIVRKPKQFILKIPANRYTTESYVASHCAAVVFTHDRNQAKVFHSKSQLTAFTKFWGRCNTEVEYIS